MIRIGVLGDIGSGKSYVAKNFGYPVFNADNEVAKLYKNNKKIFNKLQKSLPEYFYSFPADKKNVSKAILDGEFAQGLEDKLADLFCNFDPADIVDVFKGGSEGESGFMGGMVDKVTGFFGGSND